MIVVPIVIAAISNTPPTTSQRIGPLRTNALTLEGAVPVAIIVSWIAATGYDAEQFVSSGRT